MNSRNYGFGSPDLKAFWFFRTRSFIAKILVRFGMAYAELAEWIAPWTKQGAL